MTKPQGCEYNDNEYHGPPITNPNPGKGEVPGYPALTLADLANRGSMRAILDEPTPGDGLLNVMPVAPALDPAVREQAYREMDLAWRQSRLTDYNRMAAEWGLPQVAQAREQGYYTNAVGVRLSPQEAQAWQEYENRQRGQASVNGMPIRVTDDSVDALRGAYPDASRAQDLARRLNRRVNEAVINGYSNPQPTAPQDRITLATARAQQLAALMQAQGYRFVTEDREGLLASPPRVYGRLVADYNEAEWSEIMYRWRHSDTTHQRLLGISSRREQYPNPELVMQQRKAELADLYIRHGSMVPPWVTSLNPMYRGVYLNQFTRDDWFTVLGQVALTLEQRPRPGPLTETGRRLVSSRQNDIERWTRQYHTRHQSGAVEREYQRVGLVNKALDEYLPEEWQLVELCWSGGLQADDRGRPGPLTEAGRALLHARQDRVLRRCQQLGIPIEMVIEPGHEDHFNGRRIVEYSEGVFNQLLENMYTWVREQRSRAGVARHFSG